MDERQPVGLFDAVLNRSERRAAAERYLEGLAWLAPDSSPDEAAAARAAAATRAGAHLADRDRATIDEQVDKRLSLETSVAYGEGLLSLPLEAVVDGSWRVRRDELLDEARPWLRPEHQADQHWQVAEAIMRRVLDDGRVDDETLRALDEFLAEIDPQGPSTTDDPWWERFAAARLEAGLLPRARDQARLIPLEGEHIVFTEPGTVLDVYEETDGHGRLRHVTEPVEVRIDVSDQRLAVFADRLLLSIMWPSVVGVGTGEDAYGPWVQFDDARAHATHTIHTPVAELLATLARELHRRSG